MLLLGGGAGVGSGVVPEIEEGDLVALLEGGVRVHALQLATGVLAHVGELSLHLLHSLFEAQVELPRRGVGHDVSLVVSHLTHPAISWRSAMGSRALKSWLFSSQMKSARACSRSSMRMYPASCVLNVRRLCTKTCENTEPSRRMRPASCCIRLGFRIMSMLIRCRATWRLSDCSMALVPISTRQFGSDQNRSCAAARAALSRSSPHTVTKPILASRKRYWRARTLFFR